MSKVYGYCRVSTKKQSVERQIKNIQEQYPKAVMITETYTGTTTNRPNFDKLIKNIKQGDTIVFDEVSRMSRNATEGYSLYKDLFDKGVELVFLKQRYIDTSVFRETLNKSVELTGTDVDCILEGVNKYLMILAEKQIKIAFEQAQDERDMLSKRTSDGVQRAKALGKQIGRANGTKVVTNKQKTMLPLIQKYSNRYEGALNDTETMKQLDLSRNTFYKYLKAIESIRQQ